MLRITPTEEGQLTILRLEGKLSGDWVSELERCWISMNSDNPKSKFKIDMTEVECVSEEGNALLKRMFLEGVKLHAGNLLMESVVADIVEHSKAEQATMKGHSNDDGTRHGRCAHQDVSSEASQESKTW